MNEFRLILIDLQAIAIERFLAAFTLIQVLIVAFDVISNRIEVKHRKRIDKILYGGKDEL